MFLANKLNKGAGVPTPVDAQFNYVTMLLHGDGTNGAQNNTFLDSSTNNFTITRNGNTTQGSFSPYGSNWSNYFDGSGDYLTAPDNTAFNFGSGSFTIEMWIFPTETSLGALYSKATADYNGVIVAINNGATGRISFYADSTGSVNWEVVLDSTTNVPLNAWSHIACVRNSNTWTIYINGVASGTTTSSITPTNQAVGPSIGFFYSGLPANYQGYVSNLRVVKGTAVYTSAFTPSTTPLTAISGTSLLTCQSNRFIDNSANNFTITVNGNPSVQRFNPFGASTAYSTSVIGGSGYFDGSGDTVDVPTSSANAIGTSSFCIEAWIYMQNSSAQQFLVANASSGGLFIGFNIDTANRLALGRVATAIDNEVTYTWVNNQWYHVAVNRSGTSLQFFVNGVQVGSTGSNSVNYANQGYRVGSETTQKFFTGYMTDFRLTRDSVYTTTFTPNTTPLTAITNTAVLLNYTNGAIFDNAMMNNLETVGNAQISTSVKKYGTGSIAFDGTGDTLKITPDVNVNMNFGTGPFTFECWIYRSSASGQIFIADFGASSANGWALYDEGSGGNMQFRIADTDRIAVSPIPATTWTHLAVVRVGTTVTLYVNGTSAGSYASAGTDLIYAGTKYIGSQSGSSSFMNGYMDDIRITKGYARYTSTFTPPTAAFSDTGPY